MAGKGVWVWVLSAAIAISFLAMAGQGAAAPVAASPHVGSAGSPADLGFFAGKGTLGSPSATVGSAIKTLCTQSGGTPAGVYPISKKSAYVLNWTSGNLSTCGSGHSAVIASAPAGYVSNGYVGLAGVKAHGKLDLLLISWAIAGGYYCLGASTSGCASTSAFTLPSSFCASEPAGYCNPDGVILAKNLGFTYVDVANRQMVTCTASGASCSVDAASSAFPAGVAPALIAQDGSTLAVSDNNCSGNVWEGTTSSLSVIATIGDSLAGIAFHGKTVYVADTGACTDSAAHLINLKTGAALATPFTSPTEVIGLDSDLQYSSIDTGGVYLQ